MSWKQVQFYKNTFLPATGVPRLPMLVSEHTEAQSSRDLSKAMSVSKLLFSKVLPVITALTKWIYYLFPLQLPFSSCEETFLMFIHLKAKLCLDMQLVQPRPMRSCVMTHLQLFASLAKEWWQKEHHFKAKPGIKTPPNLTMCRQHNWYLVTHQGAFSWKAAMLTDSVSLPKGTEPREAEATSPERRLYHSIKIHFQWQKQKGSQSNLCF